jgi:hypothetical protein
MEMPDLDFLGDNKNLVIAGGVGLVVVLAIWQSAKKPAEAPVTGQATLIPAEGVSWDQIIARRDSGVIGQVGADDYVPGDSAYELAVKYGGFKGTMEEWLASLKGKPGDPGKPGADGKPAPEPPKPPTPNVPKPEPPKPAPPKKRPREITPGADWPYSCPAPYYMGTESTGSGHHVCIHPDSGREIQVVYKKGRGGQVVSGTGGFNPVPAPIPSAGSITVGVGDTFRSLAARAYGSPEYYSRLQKMNPGMRQLRVGEKLKV